MVVELVDLSIGDNIAIGVDARIESGAEVYPSEPDYYIDKPKLPLPNPTQKCPKEDCHVELEQCSFLHAFFTYLAYAVLIVTGYVNDVLRPIGAKEKNRQNYNPLYVSFESFYTRHCYRRGRDCWNIPICSVPGHRCTILGRITRDYGWTFEFTGKRIECINMGSYNYLGFADVRGPCTESAVEELRRNGVNTGSSRAEMGNTRYLQDLERMVAKFVGVEDSLVCGMGFATNSLNLPCILDENSLVISDEKNHASIILGLKTSGATIRVFKHNDMGHLEKRLLQGISMGRPKTHISWHKIFIVVEGVYSMEGTITNLPAILALKRKYKVYVYLDEAHSIGALGPRGRGVCDYYGVDPREVDILMGTFTKSFGSAGGYIAGSRDFIGLLKGQSHSQSYGGPMPAPVAAQILSSIKIIMGLDGTTDGVRRIRQLSRNSHYFRRRLKQLNLIVYGSEDSPVVPIAIAVPSKLLYCVREMRKSGVAIVPVGFPATSLLGGKIRFCMSAAHTKEMLDHVLESLAKVHDEIHLPMSKMPCETGDIAY